MENWFNSRHKAEQANWFAEKEISTNENLRPLSNLGLIKKMMQYMENPYSYKFCTCILLYIKALSTCIGPFKDH